MKKRFSALWSIPEIRKLAVVCFPLVPGIIGLTQSGKPLLDSLFDCVCMYVLNYQGKPPNIYVELARWAAPVATASGVLMLVHAFREDFRNYICYRRGNSVAVYGTVQEKEDLLRQLGRRGINGKEAFIRADRYVLLYDEEQNLDFYYCNKHFAKGSAFYLKCHSVYAQSAADTNLHLFCPETTAARLFWKKRCPYALAAKSGFKMTIVILGFGRLGEELLRCALLGNIFHPAQSIQYHIFGDGSEFTTIHTQLASITDPVVFHAEPWQQQCGLLEQAEMIVVAEQMNQIELLKNLLLATAQGQIDILSADSVYAELLGNERITPFCWKQEAQQLAHIFDDVLLERAKTINLRYAHLYYGIQEDERAKEAEWAKLDSFTRDSNISAADYYDVLCTILNANGIETDFAQIPSDWIDRMAELEHMRWCRFHYWNNWKYGRPENGANKDARQRIHIDLLPYTDLSDAEREKDRESIRISFGVG